MPVRLLEDFLQHPDRGLQEPDGRPLYAYRCQATEAETFRAHLNENLVPGRGVAPATAQLFCIWAAEWWRRNHSGGHWRWEDLLSAVGATHLAPGQPGYRDLCRMVVVGLRRWGRPILRTGHGRAFLVTLACEGGLPLQLLKREGASLRRYFKALLEEFRLFGDKATPEVLAERVRYRLPKSLQQDVVFELAGKLVAEIWSLQSRLGDTETPLRDLERWDTDWRDRLPLRMEDSVTRALLNNLLLDAGEIARGVGARVSFRRWMERSQLGRWQLVGELELPTTLDPKDFSNLFDLSVEEIPKRFELQWRVPPEGRRLVALGVLRGHGDERQVVLEQTPSANDILNGPEVAQANELVLLHKSDSVETKNFPGAAPLSDLPWVFRPPPEEHTEARHELVGEGSIDVRSSTAVVVYPPTCRVSPMEGSRVEDLGSLEGVPRAVCRIEGTVTFMLSDGMQVRVRTGRSGGREKTYRFTGARAHLGIDSKELFLGAPRLVRTFEAGPAQQVRAEKLVWKSDHPEATWKPLDDKAVGDGLVRYVEGDRVLFSSRLSVLPPASSLRFLPGDTDQEGTVLLHRWDAEEVALLPSSALSSDIQPTREEVDLGIHLTAKGRRPAAVDLVLRWEYPGEMRLKLPFPSLSCLFVRPDDSILPPDTTLAVGAAAGHKARVIVPEAEGDVYINCMYRGEDVGSLPRSLTFFRRRLKTVGHGHHELDLGSVQSEARHRLQMSNDAASYVRIQPQSNDVRDLPHRRLRLARFDLELVIEEEGVVRLSESSLTALSPDEIASLRCDGISLERPSDDPRSLERLRPGVWILPENEGPDQLWLLVLWHGSVCRAEPIIAPPVDRSDLGVEAGQKESVARHLDPQHLLDVPYSSDWERVDGMIHWAQAIPAVGLPDFRMLVGDPQLITLAALRASDSTFQVLWREAEAMPFWWPIVPRFAWETSAESFVQALREEYSILSDSGVERDVEDLVRQRFDEATERVTSELTWLNAPFAFLRSRLFGCPIAGDMSGITTDRSRNIVAMTYRKESQDCPAESLGIAEIPLLDGARGLIDRIRREGDDADILIPQEGKYSETSRWLLVNAPALAAFGAMHDVSFRRSQLCSLLSMRDFHPEWFDSAFGLAYLFFFGAYKRRGMDHA